jgi:protein gp37
MPDFELLVPVDEPHPVYELSEPVRHDFHGNKREPYPYGFQPTFHRYKLDEPQHWKKPRTIFVCSMGDMFGNWVPDEWIKQLFEACEAAPQHRFLFLTKNPGRYCHLERAGIMPKGDNFWFGATFDHSNWPGHDGPHEIPGRPTTFALHGKMVHDAGDFYYPAYPEKNRFVSFEPLLYDIGAHIGSTGAQWHIIGAETGNRKGKVATQREWVEHIVEYSDKNHIPVFMKESLRGLMGDDFRQEFPWEVRGYE